MFLEWWEDRNWIMAGISGFDSRQGQNIYLHKYVQTSPEPTQLPIQEISGALFHRIERLNREATQSLPCNSEI
jgi:hypothetical protein